MLTVGRTIEHSSAKVYTHSAFWPSITHLADEPRLGCVHILLLYPLNVLEEEFCELRLLGILGSSPWIFCFVTFAVTLGRR
jgi:hypothetical protein